jgi:hypothetical protein
MLPDNIEEWLDGQYNRELSITRTLDKKYVVSVYEEPRSFYANIGIGVDEDLYIAFSSAFDDLCRQRCGGI